MQSIVPSEIIQRVATYKHIDTDPHLPRERIEGNKASNTLSCVRGIARWRKWRDVIYVAKGI